MLALQVRGSKPGFTYFLTPTLLAIDTFDQRSATTITNYINIPVVVCDVIAAVVFSLSENL